MQSDAKLKKSFKNDGESRVILPTRNETRLDSRRERAVIFIRVLYVEDST